jgi:hypothetical protein
LVAKGERRLIMRISSFGMLIGFSTLCLWAGAGDAGAALDADHLTIGGEVRERYELRQDADFKTSVNDTLSFVGSRLRLNVGYEVAPDIGFFFQMQDSRLLGSETSTASNEKNLDLHQGYLTVKNLIGPLTATLGRQEMVFGDSRLVGNVGWSNIGRSFDGLRLTYTSGPVRTDLWATTVKQYGTNVGADPTVSPTNQDSQQFYGIYASMKKGTFVVEPYVMVLRDTGNPGEKDSTGALVSPIATPAARGQSRVTPGFRVDGKLLGDTVDMTAEAAYQMGSMGARGTTPKSDIGAYAMAMKAGYTVPGPHKPRIGVEYDRASGDDTAGDDKFKTFENLFPTNHVQYGYMDYVGWRNMIDLRVSFGVKPTKGSGVSIDYHRFSLAEKTDNWYAASGKIFRTTPAGNTETDLGQEVDVTAYTMVKEKIKIEAGYGHFSLGDYVKVNFSGADHGSNFIYVQTGLGF